MWYQYLVSATFLRWLTINGARDCQESLEVAGNTNELHTIRLTNHPNIYKTFCATAHVHLKINCPVIFFPVMRVVLLFFLFSSLWIEIGTQHKKVNTFCDLGGSRTLHGDTLPPEIHKTAVAPIILLASFFAIFRNYEFNAGERFHVCKFAVHKGNSFRFFI